jgi:predicted nucleic acid-binding protein
MAKFLGRSGLYEIDEEIATLAAALRRERPRLKSPDAIILATSQIRNRERITRNTKDFPANMRGFQVP